jgi:hypothetical protein
LQWILGLEVGGFGLADGIRRHGSAQRREESGEGLFVGGGGVGGVGEEGELASGRLIETVSGHE